MPQFEFTIPDECLSQSDPWPKVNVCYRVYNDSSISVSVGMESHIMAILTNTHKLKRLIDEAAAKDAESKGLLKTPTHA